MSKNYIKKTLAGIFALAIVASSTPIAPFVPVMNSNSITASAETAPETDFDFDASSGTIIAYTGTGGDVEIPSTIGGVAVTSIGGYAFTYCSNLASVTIPEGVTSIGEKAFRYCSNLTSVTIPKGVTFIDAGAFLYCQNLTSVTIPAGVTSISVSAFEGCSSLTSVTIPKGVTSIGESAFAYCSSLASVTIPEGVTSIDRTAFTNCSSLTSVTIPESVISIGRTVFTKCTNLASVTAPCTLKKSMKTAMSDCKAEITYTHPGANREEGTYKVKCACGEAEIDYTAIFTLLENEDDFLDNVTSDDYTEDSWKAFGDAAAALEKIANDFEENKFVSSQAVLTAAISAYNDAKDALVLETATDFEFDASTGTITKYTGAGGDVEIPSTIDGVAVTSIGDGAFEDCWDLISVTIPEGVTSIGASAFGYCSYLASVTIPKGVTSIGESAFLSCQSLASVTIPESVTSIGDYAFAVCQSLGSVTIPEGVTSIGEGVFVDCINLTSVTIPKGVTSIGESAFECCQSLVSVTIPEGVKSIGDYAFEECSSLASVTIPEGVTSIGEGAFYACSSLTSVTIPESVTSIGDFAFDARPNLASVTAPCTLKNSMSYAMGECKAKITYTHSVANDEEDIYIVKCACGDTDLDYTDVFVLLANEDDFLKNLNQDDYTEDSWKALYDSVTALTEIVSDFAENVFVSAQSELTAAISAYNDAKDALVLETATDFEFDDSTGTITAYIGEGGDVEIPSTIGGVAVTSIGESAFAECSSLASVTIPEGVTSIGDGAFEYCESLTSVTIPEGVTSIGDYAFSCCSNLASVTIPESVTSIGEGAFGGCSNLASVTISEGVKSIGDGAFWGCSSLTSVTIPESVTSIGSSAFEECSSLASVTIPEGVTSIGDFAFEDCQSLVSVTIPEGVTSIGSWAFAYCSSLTSITAPCTLENSMSDAMGNCTAEITYTHPGANRVEDTYIVKCASCEEEIDYTAIFELLENEDVNPDDYTEDSWNALDASAKALEKIVSDFEENKFVSSQDELTAALSAYNVAKDALEEKPQYDTLYECYLVTAPTVTELGTYNKRAYHYEGDAKVVDNETVFDTAKEVSFEQWYLRTLIQYQTDGTTFDLRFVSMLDENLDQYQKAGFIFTINGTAVSDELSTVTANTSYIVDNEEVNISAFSEDNDYFFLQNYVFDISEIDFDASLAVTAYVVLADGTELQGAKAVTFTLRQFEG